MNKLKRSHDRKVTNLVSKNGKSSLIQNTFGLPAGKAYSCPGATSVCEKVCYAGKLEKIYKGVKSVLLHNWELLRNADRMEMFSLLSDMVAEFKKDCVKRNAEMLFRIHWDGDFFNEDYTYAWRSVIEEQPDVKFWVYTRVESAVHILKDLDNLSLYYSTDSENIDTAKKLSIDEGIKLAYLSDTFAMGKEQLFNLINKTAIPCPENNRKIPLIDMGGSACVKCGQCVFNRNDILFSASKK
jgi:ferredoxin